MTKTRTSKTTKPAIPASQNEAWGFWGTMNEHAAAAWPLAMTAIADATGQPLESVRIFLDSRHGRHFADDVQNGLYRGQTCCGRDRRRGRSGGWAGRSGARPARNTASRAACRT